MSYVNLIRMLLPLLVVVTLLTGTSLAAPTLVSPSPAPFGEIESITLNDAADVYSAGVLVAGGVEMILPRNLLIDLPANRLSLQQIFTQAPAACKALGESGLAKADRCNGSGSGGIATLSAVRSNAGNVIVGDLFIQKAGETVTGVVTYINYDQGYYRVNGLPNDPATGAMVRLNDPTSRHTIQSGAGCAGGPNCSPDPRFTLDPDNYTNTFATGYPVCIPSTVSRSFINPIGGPSTSQANASGLNDYLCPDSNRSAQLNEPPVADSRRFAPVKVGDSVVAEGNYETVGGVRFLSAHSTTVQKALATSTAANQPDYLFLAEVGIEAPAFQNQRQVLLMIGFTTLAPTDVDVWSVHRDPVNNAMHEFPLASVQGCDNAGGGVGSCSAQGLVNAGANIFKINYKVDFLKGVDAKLSPCSHLLASRFRFSHPGLCSGFATTVNDIAITSPVPHEIIARTGRKITSPAGSLITIDVRGNAATNGEYLFPLGLNLGGLGTAEMSEIDLNVLNTPVIFEGIPWNLDRRLGPGGCLNAGGCEAGAVGSADFALDPFPFSGLDPRTQASLLPNGSYKDPIFSPTSLTTVRDRIFSYVSGTNFNGNATRLPYILGTFPADPPFTAINPIPVVFLFAPAAFDDSITTSINTPVVINVLDNDVAVRSSILLNSIAITTAPNPVGSGSVTHNRTNGTVTFTPAAGFTGTATFSYTVADIVGATSQPASVAVNVLSRVATVSLQSVPGTPRIAGTSVIFNAAATGGSGSYEYEFYLFNGTVWTTVQPYSANSSWAWDTAGLTAGNFTVQVNARNAGASNVLGDVKIAKPYQIIAAPAPATAVTLNVFPASSQIVGSTVNFIAAGSGGSGNYEYRFWLNTGGVWTVVQNYSTNATWTWNTTGVLIGSYPVQVDVRNAGTLTTPASKAIAYSLVAPAPPASAVTLFSTLPSPQNPGASVTFAAAGSGGSGNYLYRFWRKTGTVWSVVQNYSPTTTWTWNTTGVTPGPYGVQVDVKNVGSTTATFEAANSIAYTLASPSAPASAVALAPTLASPQTRGASITFVAAGSGGSGKYEYQFLRKTGAVWSVVQNYSPTATWTWNTTGAATGLYAVQVNVRNVGSSTLTFEAAKAVGYTIN